MTPSLMSCWVKEVVGVAALPLGKGCHFNPGSSAGMGTRKTTSPEKEEKNNERLSMEILHVRERNVHKNAFTGRQLEKTRRFLLE